MTTKEHLTLHDKQITAIRNLVHEGMRLVIETRKDIRTLVASQQRTERNLETLVNRWGRPSGFVVCLAGDKKRSPTPLGNGKHK